MKRAPRGGFSEEKYFVELQHAHGRNQEQRCKEGPVRCVLGFWVPELMGPWGLWMRARLCGFGLGSSRPDRGKTAGARRRRRTRTRQEGRRAGGLLATCRGAREVCPPAVVRSLSVLRSYY